MKLTKLPFEKKVVLLVDFVMPVAQFGNKDSKNFNGGQVCLEGYAVKYNKADLCHDSASELNETQTHPY